MTNRPLYKELRRVFLDAWSDSNGNLPCFTFIQPDGVTRAEAKALMARASICCGGTLSIARVRIAA